MTALSFYVRVALGAVFLMSAVPKLAAPERFAADVRNYRILPRPIANLFAYALPYLELGTSALLITGVSIFWAALAAAAMLVTFMAAVGIAMARGQKLSCSCFGLLYRETVGWPTQLRDGVLLAMTLLVLAFDDGSLAFGQLVLNLGEIDHAAALAFTAVALGFAVVAGVASARYTRRAVEPPIEAAPLGGAASQHTVI